MKAILEKAVAGADADYVEIRMETGNRTNIDYSGKELENISDIGTTGGCVRAFYKGGWGFVSFNDPDRLDEYVSMACRQAKLVGGANGGALAEVKPVVDEVHAAPAVDPRDVPLADKNDICKKYNDILLANDKIQSSRVIYRDKNIKRYFASSVGSYIMQEIVNAGVAVMAIARDGNNLQRAYESFAAPSDYDQVTGHEGDAEKVVERAISLLSAKPVEGGQYTVIIDPVLAGVFVHEAFGHLSEADFQYENPKLLEIMTPGSQFGVPELNVLDDGSLPGHMGTMAYDDEGTPVASNYLIKNGKMVGRLHNKETAAKLGENVSGNARAITYRYAPIVRMTNTYIDNGSWNYADILADTEDGLYVKGALGGQTSLEMFTFSAEEAYVIKNGKIGEKVRDVILSGNVFDSLKSIDAIGNDLTFHDGLGGCGKGGQAPLPVSHGSPHIRIRNVVIGGR